MCINVESQARMPRFVLLAAVLHVASATVCVQCPSGKFKSTSTNLPCAPCELNTYAPESGMRACVPCARNAVSGPGSSTCTCVSGYKVAADSSLCELECAAGASVVNGTCRCPAGTSGPAVGPCDVCPMHTFSPSVGARNCTACPDGMRAPTGSVSADACECGAGFVRNSTGACSPIADVSVVVSTAMVVQASANASMESVERAIAGAIAVSYNISADHVWVNLTANLTATRRRLLQAASVTSWDVAIRLLFPAGVSQTQVDRTERQMRDLDIVQINSAMAAGPTSVYVLSSAPTTVQVQQGVVDTASGTVVSCQTMPWSDGRGATLACAKTCGVDEDLFVVDYVSGVYVLACRRRPPPPPPPPAAGGDVMLIAAVAIAAGAAVLAGMGGYICCHVDAKHADHQA